MTHSFRHPCSMSTAEAEIIALWDAGRPVERIIRETGRHPRLVEEIVGRLGSTGLGRWQRDARDGTRALEAALAKSGGRFT